MSWTTIISALYVNNGEVWKRVAEILADLWVCSTNEVDLMWVLPFHSLSLTYLVGRLYTRWQQSSLTVSPAAQLFAMLRLVFFGINCPRATSSQQHPSLRFGVTAKHSRFSVPSVVSATVDSVLKFRLTRPLLKIKLPAYLFCHCKWLPIGLRSADHFFSKRNHTISEKVPFSFKSRLY